jgi:hypothetical protein
MAIALGACLQIRGVGADGQHLTGQPRARGERRQQRQAGAGEDRPIAQADAGHRHDQGRFFTGRLAQESKLHGLGPGPFEAGNGPFRCQ